MEDDSEICRFYWHVENPFLPLETKKALFCFGSPFLTKWKATLQHQQRRPTVSEWPVCFSLQYLPPDSDQKNIALAVVVSVNFLCAGNGVPKVDRVVFDGTSSHPYYSSISPQHGKLEIEVKMVIPHEEISGLKVKLNPLMDLSKDLKRLHSEHLYFDMWLRSRVCGTRFPVHSYILDARWGRFFGEFTVRPNPDDPPTVETNIPSDVLSYILTYLYTGSIKHLHSANRNFEDYKTDLLSTVEEKPLHPLYMMLKPEPNRQNWDSKTHISSTAVTFRLKKVGQLGTYAWTHSPLPDVYVTTFLRFFLVPNSPSFSYSLRFTNPTKLFVRVNLEYRRKIVQLGLTKQTVVYECDHKIHSNTVEIPVSRTQMKGNLPRLTEFINGRDRVEDGNEVEHSFRFILYVSNGEKCIKVSRAKFFDAELASLRILSKHMSNMRASQIGANLQAVAKEANSEPHLLHKGIFAVRMPNWRNAIENAPEENKIPNDVKCTVSNKAFPFVIEYLYTAACSPTPVDLIHQISNFARQGGLSFLERDIYAIEYARFKAKK